MLHENNIAELVQRTTALSDPIRLRLVGYLANDSYSIAELAQLVDQNSQTITEQINILRAAGLLNLRMVDGQAAYQLRADALAQTSQHIQSLAQGLEKRQIIEDDTTWIDNMDISEADKKLLRDNTFDGRLTSIPKPTPQLHVVLRWLASQFQADRTYTEREITQTLLQFHDDGAGLRRDLIDFGYLDRKRDGRSYWLIDPQPEQG